MSPHGITGLRTKVHRIRPVSIRQASNTAKFSRALDKNVRDIRFEKFCSPEKYAKDR